MVPLLLVLMSPSAPVEAVVPSPSSKQIEQALRRGEAVAQERQPPINLYAHFGNAEELSPYGIVMTKLGGVAVLSGHFALRGEKPSSGDVERILAEDVLQIVVTVFGDSPTFAKDSYLLLKQGNNLIKPTRIRADGLAAAIEPLSSRPTFRAKIVASFAYGSFDPEGQTIISVFPGVGGEVNFLLDFSSIP
ncbi:MAG: hypothetical protein AB7T38_01935 [Nitrospirales bacterium]